MRKCNKNLDSSCCFYALLITKKSYINSKLYQINTLTASRRNEGSGYEPERIDGPQVGWILITSYDGRRCQPHQLLLINSQAIVTLMERAWAQVGHWWWEDCSGLLHCSVNSLSISPAVPLLRSKLKGRLVRDRGDGGLNQVSPQGPGVALVNHFDWIKASEALNNVRGQSG